MKPAYSLREIRISDLDLVRSWRNSDRVRRSSFTNHSISKDEHEKWFHELQKNKEKLCFVFELNEKPVGLVQFGSISKKARDCEWGFYLGEEKLPKGTGTLMGSAALNYAFENLSVDTVRAECILGNDVSFHFHKKLGFIAAGRIKKIREQDGKSIEMIMFALSRSDWAKRQKAA